MAGKADLELPGRDPLRYLESMVDTWGWNAHRTDSQALLANALAVTLST